MSEPITTQKSLIVPNTGDLSGAWGTSALNPNFQTIDALFGGVTTISLSGATTLALSVPATTGVWPGGSVSQSVNSLIRFTGAQTGSATIQFALPGYYIIENSCTGTTSIRLQPSNLTGNCIGAIPGKKCHVFFDGTHMDYLNQSDPGTAYDLHTNTTTLPPWMTACTIAPYLPKDGTVYNVATYPALAQSLGSAFGGNGVTTFGVPDERNRFRLPVDSGGATGRVTTIGSGVSGSTFASAGGSQGQTLTLLQIPTGITVSGTVTVYPDGNSGTRTPYVIGGVVNQSGVQAGAGGAAPLSGSGAWNSGAVSYSASNSMTSNNTSGGAHPILPPCIVSVLALIKT